MGGETITGGLFFLLYLFIILQVAGGECEEAVGGVMYLLSMYLTLTSYKVRNEGRGRVRADSGTIIEGDRMATGSRMRMLCFRKGRHYTAYVTVRGGALTIVGRGLSRRMGGKRIIFGIVSVDGGRGRGVTRGCRIA